MIEMICKLIALTPRGYARNNWNLFDGFLVIASLLDLILSELKQLPSSSLSVMRVFRLVSQIFTSLLTQLNHHVCKKLYLYFERRSENQSNIHIGAFASGFLLFRPVPALLSTPGCPCNGHCSILKAFKEACGFVGTVLA